MVSRSRAVERLWRQPSRFRTRGSEWPVGTLAPRFSRAGRGIGKTISCGFVTPGGRPGSTGELDLFAMKFVCPVLSSFGKAVALSAVVAFPGCRREDAAKASADPQVVTVVAGAEIPAEALVREEALFAKAKAVRFEESPEMRAEIRRLVVSRFREKNAAPQITPSSAGEVGAR